MIFVTVGTHEQPFDRLVSYMDEWAGCHKEKVVIQTGYSTYEPLNCKWKKMFTYQEMVKGVEKARVVITHGGPSSFFMPLQLGKVPIVVPRKKEFNEHVNDHQVEFCHQMAERQKNIIVIDDIKELGDILDHYDERINMANLNMASNNEHFCREFEKIVNELM